MPSVVVMNAKGGVGKSTLTMALAETIAVLSPARVLLVDADGQMSLTLMSCDGRRIVERGNNRQDLVGLLNAAVFETVQRVWRSSTVFGVCDADPQQGRIDLIPGHMDLPLLEREIARKGREQELRHVIRSILAEANAEYDLVLVDSAPGISVVTEVFLRECDWHLVPCRPDFLAVAGLEYLRSFSQRDPSMGFANHLGVVINMRDPFSEDQQHIEQYLRQQSDLRCFEAAVPSILHLQKAAVFSSEPRSFVGKYPGAAGSALRAITEELVSRITRP